MAPTPYRNYPTPDPDHWVSDDVSVLVAAFNAIDTDVAALLTSVSGKAALVHSHTIGQISGLEAALGDKAQLNHTHTLGSLSDVNVAGAANGMVLVYAGGTWVVASALSVIGAHNHAISDVTGLPAALDGKLDAASLSGAASKSTPVDADQFTLIDSQASNALKRLSWANLKAALKAFFDPIYAPVERGVPAGAMSDFAGASAPSGWLLCDGSAVSRTTYAALFAVIGTTWGAGDGSTTFNLPDFRDRLAIGKGDMGGTAANRVGASLSGTRASTANGVISGLSSTADLAVGMAAFGSGIGTGAVIVSIDSGTQVTLSVNNSATGTNTIRFAVVDSLTLGATGGAATHRLTTGQLAAHGHTGTAAAAGAHSHTVTAAGGANVQNGLQPYTGGQNGPRGSGSLTTDTEAAHTHTLTINNAGGDQRHPQIPPVGVVNKIIKT